MHGLAVLDLPKVFFGASVGDHSEPVMANPLGPSLAMMFVEMNAHFVGAQRGIPFPNDVLNGGV